MQEGVGLTVQEWLSSTCYAAGMVAKHIVQSRTTQEGWDGMWCWKGNGTKSRDEGAKHTGASLSDTAETDSMPSLEKGKRG